MQILQFVKLWLGKFKYDAQKKANLAKKKQKIISLKEIKMRPVTETHDYEFKVKNAKKFIAKGDKVKFTIRFDFVFKTKSGP